jgi:hypothetical protein
MVMSLQENQLIIGYRISKINLNRADDIRGDGFSRTGES